MLKSLKFLILFCLLSFSSWCIHLATANENHQDLNGIAAVVEDHIITFNQVYEELAPLMKQTQAQSKSPEDYQIKIKTLENEILDRLIDNVLIIKEFEKQGFQIPEHVIESELAEYIQSTFGKDRSLFLKYLEGQGKDLRQFRKDFKEHLIVSAMRAKKQKSQSQISPEKIEQYYQNHLAEFHQDEQVYLRQLIFSINLENSLEKQEGEAKKAIQIFKENRDFNSLTAHYKQDNNLGWIARSDIIEALSHAAFNLNKGECSDPILVNNTLFILYIEDKKPAGTKSLDEVRSEIEFIINHNLYRENIQNWLQYLRTKAFIKKYNSH